MRHGSNPIEEESSVPNIDGLKCVAGNKLGCYFCNDITSPGDVSNLLNFIIWMGQLFESIAIC